jgi:hypothetical protein
MKYSEKIQNTKNRLPKDKNSESVAEFISEGNPNTDKVIKETKEQAVQPQGETLDFPQDAQDEEDKRNPDPDID